MLYRHCSAIGRNCSGYIWRFIMTRYIDADALIEAMNKFNNAIGEDMTHGIFYAHIAPTIDAVPVIRCKDCAFWDSEDGKKGYCNGFNLVYRQFESDYYCATAERKQE